ncbi:hypothetical protein [Salipiger sp. PrR003]|uniref:hypothetical protein n=1 Tax=Salipiger sp. PrR003 TaxID=2706776 RepID=UPI0013DA902D|nr:hypothetical protein [Salipiger sp. PrR003]NDV50127.1 hypothetical protein [Salipiger sp. PrR003]
MIGSNVGEMLSAAGRDRREAQAAVWDEVFHLMRGGTTKRQMLEIAQTRASELRPENEKKK